MYSHGHNHATLAGIVKQNQRQRLTMTSNNKENTQKQDNLLNEPEIKTTKRKANPSEGKKQSEQKNGGAFSNEEQQTMLQRKAFNYQPHIHDVHNDSNIHHNPMISGSVTQSFCLTGSQQFNQPIISINHNDIMYQATTSSLFYQHDTIDSNGNEIRGRKIDSPQLHVAREIKELDEDECIHEDQLHGFGTGSDDLANLIWNSRDFNKPIAHMLHDSPKRRDKHSKSVENKCKHKNSIGKSRLFKEQKRASCNLLNQNPQARATKSSREIRSSMGFNELLNHLDKDTSIHQNNIPLDFKNRTAHELLKLELSGIRRQSSQGKNKSTQKLQRNPKNTEQKSRSKSRDKKVLRTKTDFNNLIQLAKNQASQKHSDMLFLHNGRTQSQTSLGGSGPTAHFLQNNNKSVSKGTYPNTVQNIQRPESKLTPEKQGFKPIGNIDKLIRSNIKKMKEKEDEEKLVKQKNVEILKKKKEDLEQINEFVRKQNKDKLKKKLLPQPSQLNSQDIHHLLANEGLSMKLKSSEHFQQAKQSQSQKIDLDQIKEQIKGRKFHFKNHRKSYGLEFIDIKKEIEEELKTIDQKFKNSQNLSLMRSKPFQLTGSSTEQRIKVRTSQKQEVIEKLCEHENDPIKKVIVVKKDKIRKFMKAKKKVLFSQAIQQKNQEITRTIKMQENLIRLNKFCKKKLEKQTLTKYVKRKTVTMQNHEDERKDLSKISTRFRDRNPKKSDNQIEDSSKISTEFYEEYFRLITSIQKEQQESSSKILYSELDTSSSHKRQLVKSPTNLVNQSHSPTQHDRILSPSSQSGKLSRLGKKSKSKNSIKNNQQSSIHKKNIPRPPLGNRNPSKDNGMQSFQAPKNSRAESAPLFYQQSSLKKKSAQKKQSPSKLIVEESIQQEEFTENDHLQYILYQIICIQRACRAYLERKGFYSHEENTFQTEGYKSQVTIQQVETIDRVEADNEGEDSDEYDGKMIIINQQTIDEDKKVIYMSNINSCSLPQSPYIGDTNQQTLVDKELIKSVFEYKGKSSNDSSMRNVHQEISCKPSLGTLEDVDRDEPKREEKKKVSPTKERKIIDLGMKRDSQLKDYKMLTPKASHLLLNIADSAQKSISEQDLTSHHSITSNKNFYYLNQFSVESKRSQPHTAHDYTSQSSQSLFERNSFQQFTQSKLNQGIQNNEFSNLIGMREQALEYREKKESKFIKKMLRNNQFSPRTYNAKKEKLERWVKVEKEDIQKTKKAFKEEWQKTVQMIEETQKNVEHMREKMKISVDNTKHHQGLFNSSSSRNSIISYVGSTKQENRRSILDEEPSLTQRSMRTFQMAEQKPKGNLMDFLEEKWKNQSEIEEKKVRKSRQGIYIEDQNDKIQSSEISANENYFQHVGKQPEIEEESERPLLRSRSEQDLSELIRRSKLDHQESEEGVDDRECLFEALNGSHKLSSMQNSQKLTFGKKEDITIEENAFGEDYDDIKQKVHQVSSCQDLQSNDSILNESDLNNYFQEQKFSIEDFKSLDKRKILEVQNIKLHDEIDTDRHLASVNAEDKHNEDEPQPASNSLVEESNVDPIQIKPVEENPFSLQQLDFQQQHMHTPDAQSASIFQQHQSLIFSNAKPGENIRISDILKKTQSLNAGDSMASFILESSTNSQLLFQNQQISQNLPNSQNMLLAEQITEEIMLSLLQSSMQLPQRPIENNQHQLAQQENQDIFLIDANFNEKEGRRELVEIKQRNLIEQDLQKVEVYINEIIGTLLQSEIQSYENEDNTDISNFHRQFLSVLTVPIKRNELDLLNQLQTSEIGSYDHFETAMDHAQHPILPVDLYLELERLREEVILKQMANGQDLNIESSILQESLHIHNKAIFDALNESLMKFRPYGLSGEPMPWSNKNRRLQTKVDASSVDTERLFQLVKQDVLRWVSTYSGCQPSQLFIFKKPSIQQGQEEAFDEELFQETRERRLAQMLANEVVENEHLWLNYEFEEGQVKVDLSDMILEHLVEEVVVFLNNRQGLSNYDDGEIFVQEQQ